MLTIDTTTYRRDISHKAGDGYDLRPAGAAPSSIVIHSTNGVRGSTFASEAKFLRDNQVPVSAHYLVGKDGRVAQILADHLEAWHAGETEPSYRGYQNAYSLGIENHHAVGDSWPEAQKQALTELCRLLMERWRIPANRIEMHRVIAPKRKTDPNDWESADFYAWRDSLSRPTAQHQVIGVRPSITLARFHDLLTRRKAPFEPEYFDIITERIYRLASDLDIDPAFWLAMWTVEQGTPLGGSQVGRITRNPLNIRAYGRWPKIAAKGAEFNVYSSWQIGCMASLLHLKDIYGAVGLLTVEQIIPVLAPETDNNDPVRYIAAVLADMRTMQAGA